MKKTRKNTNRELTTKRKRGKDSSAVRDAIVKRADDLNLSKYDVAKAVAGRMSAQAVYDFMAGRKDMTSRRVSDLLFVLGLEIVPAAAADSRLDSHRGVRPERKRKQT